MSKYAYVGPMKELTVEELMCILAEHGDNVKTGIYEVYPVKGGLDLRKKPIETESTDDGFTITTTDHKDWLTI